MIPATRTFHKIYTLIVHIIVTQNRDPPSKKTLFLTNRHHNLQFLCFHKFQKNVIIICSRSQENVEKRNDNLFDTTNKNQMLNAYPESPVPVLISALATEVPVPVPVTGTKNTNPTGTGTSTGTFAKVPVTGNFIAL